MLRDRDLNTRVSQGGTGRQKFTSHGVLIGNDGGAINVTATGSTGQVLVASNSASTLPSFLGVTQTQSNVAAPTGTANTTGVMMGLAGAITPVGSGVILFIISGDVTNNTKSDGAGLVLRYGTGTAPTNAAALTGTATSSQSQLVNSTATSGNFRTPFGLAAIVSGFTLNTAVWFDLAVKAITGGTATVANCVLTAFELK